MMKPRPPYDAGHPPRFLECQGSTLEEHDAVVWILHTAAPRFLAGSDDHGVTFRVIQWFDDPSTLDAAAMARLMREMGDWYTAYLNDALPLNRQ